MGISDADENPLLRRSDILIADGEYEKAILCLDKILDESPEDEQAMSLKGLAYCLKGDVEKGIDIFEEALKTDPSSKTLLITFADACLRSSMPQKSLKILERAITYHPDDDGLRMLKTIIISAGNRRKISSFFN